MSNTPGSECEGKFAQQGSTERTIYCNHPKAKAFLCPELCARGLCPKDVPVPKAEQPKAKKSVKAEKWKPELLETKAKKTGRSAARGQ